MNRDFNEFMVPQKPNLFKRIRMSEDEIIRHNRICTIVRKAAEERIDGKLKMNHYIYTSSKKNGIAIGANEEALRRDAEYYKYLDSIITGCLDNQILTLKEKLERIKKTKRAKKILHEALTK